MFVLPDDLRDTLKEPLGMLVDEQKLLELLQDTKLIVSVGDLVTYTLLKNGINPTICIVDYILERKEYSLEMKEKIKEYCGKHTKIKNPPGAITDELWHEIGFCYKNLKKEPFCIEIDGEEDLAALPAIYLAPSDVTVIYGMPNKGVVIVDPTTALKQKVKEILNRM